MSPTAPASTSLRVWYDLTVAAGEDPAQKALDLALEQTVELPADLVAAEVLERAAGRVEEVAEGGPGRFRAAVAFPAEVWEGADAGTLLALLFGNASLQRGVRVAAVDWPPGLLQRPDLGPRCGIAGVRSACGVAARRPLLATALKPLGTPAADLARQAGLFARGGIDLIKDDHGLADPPGARFAERLARCQEAVAEANRQTGGSSLYVPHLTGPPAVLAERLAAARAAGCRGVLIEPLGRGLDTLGWIGDAGLFALAHPALTGAFFGPDHGIAPGVLLGQILRLAGADGVIYPHAGGRFAFSLEDCAAVENALRAPFGGSGAWRPAFPVPAGGLDLARLPGLLDRLGPDTILLIGGSLYREPDPVESSRRLAALLREWTW
jgi:ribulose-bisphosphate carboxylase large chain